MAGIFHRTLGKGTPVVLLHGFCESNEVWGEFATRLAARFQVIIPDLPGFGQSTLPAAPFSIDAVATQMWTWLGSMKITNPVLVGHSLGGYVTLAMAKQQPDALSGFCLFHSTAKADTEEKKANRNKVMAFVTKNGVAPFIDTYVPGLFYKKDHPAMSGVYKIAYSTRQDSLVAYAEAMRDRPVRTDILEAFNKPVLIIAGEKDEIIPLDTLMPQAVLLEKGRLSVLSDTGHMGMLEATSRSVETVTQFVGSCGLV